MLHDVKEVQVQRCYSQQLEDDEEIFLHIFVDASSEAFAAVAYLVTKGKEGIDVALLGSKARVAPLKKLTIPRMELQAALLGARLAKAYGDELRIKVNRRIFWSDSKTVLSWIRSESGKFKEFVANRVGEIQEITEAAEWKWVPTDLNVADIATRFDGKISFSPENVWFTGPTFLRGLEIDWPKERNCLDQGSIHVIQAEQVVVQSNKPEDSGGFPLVTRFSSYQRILRVTAAVISFVEILKRKAQQRQEKTQDVSCLPIWTGSIDEGKIHVKNDVSRIPEEILVRAEKLLVRSVQQDVFKDVKLRLKKGKLAKLSPVYKDGILCVKTRIQNADIPEMTKFPMILPAKHHLTELVIMDVHQKCAHQGRETVLNTLRQRFWIIDGRQAVLRVTRKCGKCRLWKASPVIPEMGNLPNYRLAAYRPAFTFTGVDYAGPFEVTIGRRHEKRWIALFTCLVTRGIHLEVAHGLTTEETLLAVNRFVSTRGKPNVIFSDNGTNFVGASKETVITWSFIPPAAPNFGGAWESLVKSVKRGLNVMLKEQYPKESTFLTAVKEVEGILNSRPITHVSNDPTDPMALTPNHFLRGGCDEGPALPTLTEVSPKDLRNQWGRCQFLVQQFWDNWTRDFLPRMMLRDKWLSPTEPLRIGDLVFLVDADLPRNKWIRGFISRVIPGVDNQVRVVEVTTKKENGQWKIFKRLASRVAPLGLQRKIQEDELPKSGAGMEESVELSKDE